MSSVSKETFWHRTTFRVLSGLVCPWRAQSGVGPTTAQPWWGGTFNKHLVGAVACPEELYGDGNELTVVPLPADRPTPVDEIAEGALCDQRSRVRSVSAAMRSDGG